ncbi:hypothetical protein BCR35DRAFT_104403 [Leucosporidium creatinivorum]|uniref:Uncharacterized protein n=1 Tax=Leucosporidium creatinivorum TaxID=106004 RepID=A0A1Y2G2X1_9BASI|nr:hypothetical protein BCR35DRAFT_104403 [Leucosporidium creatinivorum]
MSAFPRFFRPPSSEPDSRLVLRINSDRLARAAMLLLVCSTMFRIRRLLPPCRRWHSTRVRLRRKTPRGSEVLRCESQQVEEALVLRAGLKHYRPRKRAFARVTRCETTEIKRSERALLASCSSALHSLLCLT